MSSVLHPTEFRRGNRAPAQLRAACAGVALVALLLCVVAVALLAGVPQLGPTAGGAYWAFPMLGLAGLSCSGWALWRARLLGPVAGGSLVADDPAETRLKLVARATSDAIYDWNRDTGELWWGDGFFERFGYPRENYASNIDAWVEALHPDDVEAVEASLQRAIEGGESSWEERYRLRRADGSYAEVIDRGFILRDASGRAQRMVGGVLDISERLRDEADLRLLRRAMESADNGVLIIDARVDGMPVAYVNPAFERISGYSAEELVGCVLACDDASGAALSVLEGVRRAITERHEGRMMLRGSRRDGTAFWQELHVSPVRERGNETSHYVAIVSDVSERERVQQQLAYRASHDELTGLPNRQVLLQRLAQLIERAPETGRAPSVLFIDLDHFKLINDTMGHAVGDRVLIQVAERIRAAIPHAESISRFGGDEFVAVLRESGGDNAAAAAKRVMAQLTRPLEGLGSLHYLTPSIGYATWPGEHERAEDLLKHADLAMYQAKKRGRNSMVAYTTEMNDEALEKLHLVTRLREALERDEFVVHFQPQFDARDGMPIGLEALIRWNHPERGLLPPGAFIDVAEDSGLIIQIGRWVLHETARHHRALAESGWGHISIAVNVSATQFLRGELLAEVGTILAVHDIPPGAIELELTESVVLENPDAAIATMEALRELGVALSIDDFGTGYSSLGYLRQLPADKLKLDRGFVADLGRDPKATAICATVIKLAQSIGLRVVAEGVETVEQYRWLRRHGCDEVQGFLFARPLPFEEALAVLDCGRIDPAMRAIEDQVIEARVIEAA